MKRTSGPQLIVCVLFAAMCAACDAADARAVLRDIGFDQNLGREIQLDLKFRDETDRELELKSLFGQRPILIALVYHNCPMLCGAELNGLVTCLRAMKQSPGKEFDIIVVSFDPADTPAMSAAKKAHYLRAYNRAGTEQGWHFLTGTKESIGALTAALGFSYKQEAGTGQFMHASGLVLATPRGRISKYFFGIEYYPRDLQFGVLDASDGRVGTLADRVLLYCYRYDPLTGKYGLAIFNLLKMGGLMTVVGVGLLVGLMRRRVTRTHLKNNSETAAPGFLNGSRRDGGRIYSVSLTDGATKSRSKRPSRWPEGFGDEF
jgi:protein SCO1/2